MLHKTEAWQKKRIASTLSTRIRCLNVHRQQLAQKKRHSQVPLPKINPDSELYHRLHEKKAGFKPYRIRNLLTPKAARLL